MAFLFDKITMNDKDLLLKLLEATTFTFKKHTNILTSLKKDNIVGVVESGRVQIIRNDYDGNRVIIDELNQNDVFGTMISSMIGDNYDIIVKEDNTKIIIIDYSNITNFNSTQYNFFNQFIKNLLVITTDKIVEKNDRIEVLTQKSIRDKLLEYFRIISEKKGGKTFDIPFSFTELAEYLGVDRSAMSRELKNLKDEGFIKVANKRVTLLY